MTQGNYRVRIVIGDHQFEAEGDKKFVLDMLDRYEKTTVSMLGSSEKPAATERLQSVPGKAESVGEFIRRLGLKRHSDLVVAFGYYLEHYSGVTEFTPADINNCYYEAKLESSNTSQMLINGIKRGFVMESKSVKKGRNKSYTLTHSGEEFINTKLSQQSE